MADDPRTEARRRIAERIAFARYNGTCPADAVLDLFPDVTWHRLGALPPLCLPPGFPPDREYRRLLLNGAVEPVVPEEPA